MKITKHEVLQILRLFDASHFTVINLQVGDVRLDLQKVGDKNRYQTRHTSGCATDFSSRKSSDKSENIKDKVPHLSKSHQELVPILAPMLGLFSRSPASGVPPYVEVGDEVIEEDTVALINVMNVSSPVKAGLKGRIVGVCSESNQLVGYHQELFYVQPYDDANDSSQESFQKVET